MNTPNEMEPYLEFDHDNRFVHMRNVDGCMVVSWRRITENEWNHHSTMPAEDSGFRVSDEEQTVEVRLSDTFNGVLIHDFGTINIPAKT